MDKIPFSVYDFFAYLSSGTVWLVTADYLLGTRFLDRDKVGPLLGVALVIFAYACGHVVAHFSSFILEHIVIGRIMKRPNAVLLGDQARWPAYRWMFPNYFRPLPHQTQERVIERAVARGVTSRGEALFLHTYAVVTSVGSVQARLDEFRNQYGFARNMSFAFLTSALAILVAHHFAWSAVQLRWAVLSAGAGITLFYRYLKFFRQYSYELFLRYAELPAEKT